MPLKTIFLVASLFGLTLVWAIPSSAQPDGSDAQAKAIEAWRTKIVSLLESKKEFPPEAIGQAGTTKVVFVFDRQGKLISKEVLESSGSELLDAEALKLIERAQPFPEPPAEVRDDSAELCQAEAGTFGCWAIDRGMG